MNHHAKIKNSKRLQKVLDVLMDGRPHTSLEIAEKANTIAPASCIAELRTNHIAVDCKYKGLSDSGRKIYEYRLEIPHSSVNEQLKNIPDLALNSPATHLN